MRFSFFAITTLLITTSANSQVQWNIFAGPQATSASYTVADKKQDTKMKYGFQAGVGMKVGFENKLFFAPAVFYSLKGYKATFNLSAYPPHDDAKDNNTTIHSFELAALLQYDFSNEPGHFFIKAGPSIDIQISGNEKYFLRAGGYVEQKMKFSYADYGHYSANVLAQLGYETSSGFLIFGQYTHGLASISNTDLGPVIRHRVIGLSVGKFLNRK